MEDNNITNSSSDREGIQTCDLPFMDERKGYKKTKLGWIPEDWEECNFGSLADKKVKWSITGGPFGSNLKVSDYFDTGVRIIQLQNIGDGEFKDNYEIYTSEQKADELLACNIYPDEIILSKMGDPVARACIMPSGPNRYLMASDGIRLVVDERKYNKHFVLNYLNYKIFRNFAISHSTGSTRQRIGLNDLKKLPFVKPPLPEQQKIATILSTWDRAIAKQEQLITAKQEFKKGLMQFLLTGKKRFEGFEGEWKMQEIGKFGKVVSGLTYKPENISENGDLVLRSSNIQNGKLTYNDNVYVSNSEFNPVEKDDILICVRNGSKHLIGKNTLITEDIAGVAFGAFMSVFRSKRNRYLKHLFETDLYRKEIHKNLGATINSINSGNLKRFKFLFPQDEEQQKITAVLSAADKEIGILQSELAELRRQKRGLMQQLLTGEKRVKI